MATLDVDAPSTLPELLDRDPLPVDDEVTILVRLSRRNLHALCEGIPCSTVALKPYDHPAPDPIGVYRIAAEGGIEFRDGLPVRR